MSKPYVKFKQYKRGVPNTNPSSLAKYRKCMHCGSRATWTAVRVAPDGKVMDVRYCDTHVEDARRINGKRRRR